MYKIIIATVVYLVFAGQVQAAEPAPAAVGVPSAPTAAPVSVESDVDRMKEVESLKAVYDAAIDSIDAKELKYCQGIADVYSGVASAKESVRRNWTLAGGIAALVGSTFSGYVASQSNGFADRHPSALWIGFGIGIAGGIATLVVENKYQEPIARSRSVVSDIVKFISDAHAEAFQVSKGVVTAQSTWTTDRKNKDTTSTYIKALVEGSATAKAIGKELRDKCYQSHKTALTQYKVPDDDTVKLIEALH